MGRLYRPIDNFRATTQFEIQLNRVVLSLHETTKKLMSREMLVANAYASRSLFWRNFLIMMQALLAFAVVSLTTLSISSRGLGIRGAAVMIGSRLFANTTIKNSRLIPILTCLIATFLVPTDRAMAENANLFRLEKTTENLRPFSFNRYETLDFSTWSPDGFLWNTVDETIDDFDETGSFTDFRLRNVGYFPLDRDRFTVRIYTAKIVEDRVAIAGDYARMLAASWGPLNYGNITHRKFDFGEAMTGNDKSGIDIVTRISVVRRSDELLIIRSDFHKNRSDEYLPMIDKIVGSIEFSDPVPVDFVEAKEVPYDFVFPDTDAPKLTLDILDNWRDLEFSPTVDKGMDVKAFVDESDPTQTNAQMVFTMVGLRESGVYELEELHHLAGRVAEIFYLNLLPGLEVRFEKTAGWTDPILSEIADNGFGASIITYVPERDLRSTLQVFLLQEANYIVAIATSSPNVEGSQAAFGSRLHSTFQHGLSIESAKSYFEAIE